MSWLVALCARLALLVVWLSTPLVQRAFHGGWILPLLGIIFLPITTLAYVLVYYISGSSWHSFSTWQRIVSPPGAPDEQEAEVHVAHRDEQQFFLPSNIDKRPIFLLHFTQG
jgi:hypothetical protein